MLNYMSLIRLIRRRIVLGLIFALSLTYCTFSLLQNEEKGSLNRNLDDVEPVVNDNVNEDVDDGLFAEELTATDKPPWQVEVLDQMINDNAKDLDMLNLNKSDLSARSCRNSVQGKGLIVDEHGVVCTRHEVQSNGCCNLEQILKNEQASFVMKRERYSCKTCNSRGCCTIYEYCVSCCLHPSKPIQQIRSRKDALSSSVKTQKDGKIDARNLDRFQICLAACRTSSSSLWHENTYKDPLAKHCYVRQLPKSQKPRRNINSLNNNGDSHAVVVTSSSVVTLLSSFLSSECRLFSEYRLSNHPLNKSSINSNCPSPRMLTLARLPGC